MLTCGQRTAATAALGGTGDVGGLAFQNAAKAEFAGCDLHALRWIRQGTGNLAVRAMPVVLLGPSSCCPYSPEFVEGKFSEVQVIPQAGKTL